MVTIKHLTFRFGSRTILNDISAHFAPGSFHAVMGCNGCGKTTLLRCIDQIIKPQQGEILIQGTDPSGLSPRMLAQKISFVQQQPITDFEFSAFEIVLMGRNPYQHRLQNESKQDWDIVEQAMKLTHTWELRFAKPHQMSGGELQRVMIARALAQNTPIMLLDEPTSNLDIEHQLDIMRLLSRINKEQHKTLLLVIHDLHLAKRFCPDLVLMHQGHLLYQGPTDKGLTDANIRQVFHVDATELFFGTIKEGIL